MVPKPRKCSKQNSSIPLLVLPAGKNWIKTVNTAIYSLFYVYFYFVSNDKQTGNMENLEKVSSNLYALKTRSCALCSVHPTHLHHQPCN